MESCNKNELKYVTTEWIIENFHFCWHKTGERLESPAFIVHFSRGTYWRLWLYPRGEDDGEYISLFLFRDEGGPEVVHVDFELYLYITRDLIGCKQTLRGCSFNVRQREGIKCFVPRSEIHPHKTYENNSYLLRLGCTIFNLKSDRSDFIEQTVWMTIGMERVYGTEICDNVADLEPHCNQDIAVKPLLENEPLINLNISHFENNLVIKILPVNCKKIKYAICKVTVINNLWKESVIEHVREWIGEIKKDIRRYRVFLPETKSFKPKSQTFTDKTFFVRYDFAFSTGETAVVEAEQYDEFLMPTHVSYQQYLNAKSPKFAKTALDLLEENYRSLSYIDIHVKTITKTYPTHKAILCSRSPLFKSVIQKNSTAVSMKCFGFNCDDLFRFLYTDNLVNSDSWSAIQLYVLSNGIHLELLKTQMRNFLIRNLHHLWAIHVLFLSVKCQDSFCQTAVENYITTHYDSVLSKSDWQQYKNSADFCKKFILLKYKKQQTTP